jgi:hypothetical protein
MACLGSDSNHQSPLLLQCQPEAEWAGILMDEHVRPGQLSLLLCSPAKVATWCAFEIARAPVTCTRMETWTSYRGADCENKQGRSLDFLQGVRLREQTGEKLGYHTGGKTARTNRVEAGTSYREESCENKQGRGWYISRGIDLRRIPVRLDDLKSLRHSRCLAFPAF